MKSQNGGAHAARSSRTQPANSAINELLALEQLRIIVSRINQIGRERPVRVIAVTSSIASEGKTTIATNLAIVMAKFFGKKTLLIDADFRKPGVAGALKTTFTHGLTDVLKGEMEPAGARWQLPDQQLTVLPLIKPERDAAHLLAHPTARRRLQEAMEGFDAVIIDAPPVLPLADSNLLADLVDGFIFVVKAEQTPQRLITSALKCVPKNKMFGFVLNNAQLFGRAAYGHHYYGAGYFDMSAKP